MNSERQLYIRDGSRFTRLPEVEGGVTLADILEMKNATEAKLAIEGVSDLKARYLAFGDHQIPDLDYTALNAVLKVNEFYKATHIDIMGDLINATTVSSFGVPAEYGITLQDEIDEAKYVLKETVTKAREANPQVKIRLLEGNHENRIVKYLDKHAKEIAGLRETNGEKTIDLPRLLGVNELGIEWIPYWKDEKILGKGNVLHGNIVRSKSGYTGHAYLDRYGDTTIAGHTHRLALIARTVAGEAKYAVETGSLCKREMKVPYMRPRQADWQQGFALVGVDKKNVLYPSAVAIINGRAVVGDKLFDGKTRA